MTTLAERSATGRAPSPPAVYGLADGEAVGLNNLPTVVEALAGSGVEWIQLRLKQADDRQRYQLIKASQRHIEALHASRCRLWVNDRADLAALCEVDGVHLGQDDLTPRAARAVVGEAMWIGWSCHNVHQVAAADQDDEVDVVAIGPVFATRSKRDPDPVVGIDGVRSARALTDKPLVAIGGIDGSRLASVLAAGADTAAVLGALYRTSGSTESISSANTGRDTLRHDIARNVGQLQLAAAEAA